MAKSKQTPSDPFSFAGPSHSKLKKTKDLTYDEAFLDVNMEEGQIMDDERASVDLRMFFLILLVGFAALAIRIYFLQGIKGAEYRGIAEGNKLRVQYVLAPRGLILDRSGKTIAGNVPGFELVVNPADLPADEGETAGIVQEVATVLQKDPQEIEALIVKFNRNVFGALTVEQNLTKDQALILISRQDKLKGFSVQNNPIRDYKDPLVFSHLVGYTGKITADELSKHPDENYLLNDEIGKTGLEIEYQNYLRGVPGQRQSEIDAQGNIKKSLAELPASPGNNLRLNIDYELQKQIYDSLTSILRRGAARRAAAIATDPKSGKVLALVSLPSFDNNWFARGITSAEYKSLIDNPNIPLLNRTISGTYPPGSTVKPMLAIAGLTEGIVTTSTKILDDGVIRVGNYTFYGYERSGLGLMDIYSALAKSSDIYFYTLGGGNSKTKITGLGPDKLAEWFRKFHLGTSLGIDMPNEKNGLVPDPDWKLETKKEKWFLGDTYHYSIGQGDLLVTPLQVNSWTATIANGGKIMEPMIVDEVTEASGKVIEKKQPKVLSENFLDPQWVKVSQDGMRQAVTSGTARSLNQLPVTIAGKTGTAQFDAKNLSRTHAWFTSYAPFENPQIALTILVESGGEGSSISVPVAKEVYTWWAENRYQK
ncbi:MAG TPA: penicillin-binding protein 2 [Patescibacteria group bacterium]|jgi:penicillin-binding protein 2|nr:penicillin-binding protein 2 [Patescibacteria group bacterium]